MEEKSDDPKEDDDSKSIHSAFSNFHSLKRDPAQDTKEKMRDKGGKNKKESILTWPQGLFNQIVYVVLYPFHLVYWLVMPNIYDKPEIIKVDRGYRRCSSASSFLSCSSSCSLSC